MGLANLALLFGQLSASKVFGHIRQALHHAPQYSECHNLLGLVYEARCDYLSAVASYKVARATLITSSGDTKKLLDISVNLARTFCKVLIYFSLNIYLNMSLLLSLQVCDLFMLITG